MCSKRFATAQGQRLDPDEVLTLKLPAHATKVSWYLHLEPSFDTRLLPGKDFEVCYILVQGRQRERQIY